MLRYWEDELGLPIPRNELGHRYYTEFHIQLFRQIKQLKEQGYQLKAIRGILGKVEENQKTEPALVCKSNPVPAPVIVISLIFSFFLAISFFIAL